MIIETELDTKSKELFVTFKGEINNTHLLRNEVVNYFNENLNSKFKLYFFLSDNTWSYNSKRMCYIGLWKQRFIKESFGKYAENIETKFLNKDETKVLFATYFKIDLEDLVLAIENNATINAGHSFIFLSISKPEINVSEIFDSLGISDDKYFGNNWESIIKCLHSYKCIPVQKWSDSKELSLRFFLNDEVFELFNKHR